MLSPQDFVERWTAKGDILVRFSSQALEDIRLPLEAKQFLLEAGLPDSAAPFLAFEAPKMGPLPNLAAHWDLPSEFEQFRVIGFNGYGDPICLDEENGGKVVYFNHDNDFALVLINSSVPQLAASLLIYRDLVKKVREINGDAGFFEGDIPVELVVWLKNELLEINPEALSTEGFWQEQLTELRTQSESHKSGSD